MFLSSRASATSSAEKYWQISTEENTWSSWIGTCCNKNPSVRICRLRSNFSKGMIETKKMTLLAIVVSNKYLWQSQEVLNSNPCSQGTIQILHKLFDWVGGFRNWPFLLTNSTKRVGGGLENPPKYGFWTFSDPSTHPLCTDSKQKWPFSEPTHPVQWLRNIWTVPNLVLWNTR